MKNNIQISYQWCKDELMNLPLGKYNVVIDLNKDDVIITDKRTRKGWLKLGAVNVSRDTKKARQDVARDVRGLVDKLEIVCKSTVKKTYGKDIAEAAPVWLYVDNPYYKCSNPMQLYLLPSIQYLYGEKEVIK